MIWPYYDFICILYHLQYAEVFSQQPLKSLDCDGSLRKVVDFLMNLCRANHFSFLQSCLCGLSKSTALVEWLRHDVQGKCG